MKHIYIYNYFFTLFNIINKFKVVSKTNKYNKIIKFVLKIILKFVLVFYM